jgi:hypothetical protein
MGKKKEALPLNSGYYSDEAVNKPSGLIRFSITQQANGLDGFLPHADEAFFTYVLAFEVAHFVGIAAEHAGRLIFTQDNAVIININFERIFFLDIQGAA